MVRRVGWLLVGSGLAVAGAANWGLPIDLLISATRERTPGMVDAIVDDCSLRVDGACASRIEFRYSTHDTTYNQRVLTADRALVARARQTRRVTVEYSGRWPRKARIEGTTIWPLGYLGLLTLIAPLLGVSLTLLAWRSRRDLERAFVYGTPVTAQVLRRGPDTSTTVNGAHPFQICWRFTTARGETVEGALSHLTQAALAPFDESDAVPVLYLAGDPRRNALYVGESETDDRELLAQLHSS